jgi:putative ABC transport system substrate-binding protein
MIEPFSKLASDSREAASRTKIGNPNLVGLFALSVAFMLCGAVGAAEGDKAIRLAFAELNKQRPDGLYVSGGPLRGANRKRTAGFATKNRLPPMYNTRAAVDGGGLMSYGADAADSYRRVATYVDKILKGAKPADLPVQQPTKFELVINLKTAKQIGVNIPQSLLYRADKVIK